MGSKKVLPPYVMSLAPDAIMTGTATIQSPVSDVTNLDNIAYDVSWTGTAVGIISVMASLTGKPGTFKALTFSPQLAQPSGADGGYLISLNQLPFDFVYVSYTNASGTGVLATSICAKDLN